MNRVVLLLISVFILLPYRGFAKEFNIKDIEERVKVWERGNLPEDVKFEIENLKELIKQYYVSSYKEDLSIKDEIRELIKLELLIIEKLIEINELKKRIRELQIKNLELFKESEILKGKVEELIIKYRGMTGEKDF